MEFTLTFIRLVCVGIYLAAPLVLFLCLLIAVLGLVVGRMEGWSKFDSVYWAMITALTVGYGDIRPLKRGSKTLAVAIVLAGLMFSGIFVSIAVHSAFEARAGLATSDSHVSGKVNAGRSDNVITSAIKYSHTGYFVIYKMHGKD
jgi:voltage-gated potassium channel